MPEGGNQKKIHLHPNANKNGFAQRPHDAGRKPLLINQLIKAAKKEGYEGATVESTRKLLSIMMEMPLSKLREIAGSPNDSTNQYPAVMRIYAHELLGKGKLRALESLLDRSQGKAQQSATITLEGATQTAIPPETAAQLADILKGMKGVNEDE